MEKGASFVGLSVSPEKRIMVEVTGSEVHAGDIDTEGSNETGGTSDHYAEDAGRRR